MKKKRIRILSIIAGIVFLLFLVVNFGINFWLKNNLDSYIKNNSDYIVTYITLNVDLGTGNIFSTGVTINNKNPQNQEIIGFQGTVDTISVSRLGIYDAIFKKRIKTSDLVLNKPHLNIILPKNNDKKAGKQTAIILKNIKITEGNIQVFKATKQKMLSVSDLNLVVDNLQLTEQSASGKLPFTFDDYQVNGKNLYFRTDNIYALTAKYITTKDGQVSVKDLAVIPLLSYQNFTKFYPKKRNLFDFKSSDLEFKDIVLKDNKVTLTKVRFENPELKMFTTNVKPAEKEKSFKYDVQLKDVLFNNAKINIVQPNGSPLFSAGNLTMNIKEFLMNEETARGNIPFEYNDFKINGQKINYVSNTQNVNVSTIALDPKMADFKNISMKPTVSASDKTLLDLSVQHVNLKINDWKFLNNKLKLNIDNVQVNELSGKIVGSDHPKKIKKPAFEGIAFPLIIKNISLKNSNLVYDKGSKPLAFENLNATIQNIEMNEKTVKQAVPFKIGFYSLSSRNFKYKTKFYDMSAALLKLNKNTVQVSNFAIIPTVSRAQFIRMIPTEKDLYDIKVKQISMKGKWDLLSDNQFLEGSQVTLNGMDANVFRSKIPDDDLTEKPMYSKLLRSIKFPMFIDNLDIKNSLLVYEEDTKKSDGPGKLTFSNFNVNVKNVNSGKTKGRPTQVAITIRCLFMNASPMNIKWGFDTLNTSDVFSISGNVADLPAARINAFTEPYLKVRATGLISDLIFNFKGNFNGLGGTLKMKNENLKITLLTESGNKNTLLSAVANIFVKTDSGNYPESVEVKDVERDKTKSFFNLLWKGIEQGLKKTLLGIAPKTEEAIKKTVDNTKTALQENKKDLQETKVEVKKKVEAVKEKVQETKKKGVFKNIFKKKSAS